MRIPDLVVVFASNHFVRKVLKSCSKVEKNMQKKLENHVKSCKNMIFVDFETIYLHIKHGHA